MLAAIHEPAPVNLHRRRVEGRLARRRRAVGLRERLGEDVTFLDDPRINRGAARLVVRPLAVTHGQVVGQLAGPEHGGRMHVEGKRRGAAPAPELGGNAGVGTEVSTEPAIALVDGEAEEARFAQIGIVLVREPRFLVVGPPARQKAVPPQLAGNTDQFLGRHHDSWLKNSSTAPVNAAGVST